MSLFLFWIFLFQDQELNQQWRMRMLADIQASFETHPTTAWDATDPQSRIQLQWEPPFASDVIRFERRFILSPDDTVTLVEIWRMAPKDLRPLLQTWGHPDNPNWADILSVLPDGRVLVNETTGELLIIRDFEIGISDWNMPPFPLDHLPTQQSPHLSGDTPQDAEQPPEQASTFSLFLTDLVNEELQDREGAGVRLSKKWRLERRSGRFNPQLRIERRLKFNFDNTYTVFDIYSAEVDLLVGDRSFQVEDDYTSEAGLLFEAQKTFVVVRQGYKKWYQALFANFFSPTRLPYNTKNLERLPVGVRIIMPTTTGLTLVERYAYTGLAGEDYPLEVNGFLGTRSSFFISISKRTSSSLDLRFGARIERPFYLELRGRPNFDGPLDPRRLLMGTVIQTRLNRIYGSRIFLQKDVDLNDDKQVKETVNALRRGIRLNGLVLGTAAIFNFTFSPKIDTYLLDKRLAGKLPELDWESRIQSKYKEKEAYGKFGFRPFSARAQKTELVDNWKVLDLLSGHEFGGKSASFVYQRNLRFFKYITRRRLQVLSLESGESALSEKPAPRSIQILDVFSKSRLGPKKYQKRTAKLRSVFGESPAFDGAGAHPPEKRWKNMEMGYRLIVSEQGLNQLAAHLLSRPSDSVSKNDPLRRFLVRHPVLKYRLRRYQDDLPHRDVLLGKYLFKLARRYGSLSNCLKILGPEHYYLEYRELVAGKLLERGLDGNPALGQAFSDSLRTWEELEVFDDIFIDRSLSNRFQR